jgi:hypothetical protein
MYSQVHCCCALATALHHTTRSHVPCVRLSQDGNTPLHLAAKQGTAKIVRVLLTAHANAGATNDVGDTPLHMVARQGLRSAEDVIKMLLDESADPAAVNNVSGDTMGKPRCCTGSPPQNAPSLFGYRVWFFALASAQSGSLVAVAMCRHRWPPPDPIVRQC